MLNHPSKKDPVHKEIVTGIFTSFSMKCWRAQYFNFSTWAELWKIEYLRGSSFCNIANNKLKKVKLYHLSENQILNKLYFVKFEG